MQANPEIKHSLVLEGRQKATVTGVSDVDCFNEQIVILITSAGSMTLAGEGLHIENLNLKDGTLEVEGEIASIEYTGRPREKKGGVFGRLFR